MVLIRPMPPLASVIPELPKSLNQPTSSGVYGRKNASAGRPFRSAQSDSPSAP